MGNTFVGRYMTFLCLFCCIIVATKRKKECANNNINYSKTIRTTKIMFVGMCQIVMFLNINLNSIAMFGISGRQGTLPPTRQR
jgi:hypothetical protein